MEFDNKDNKEEYYRGLIESFPENALNYYNLGNVLYRQGKYEEAVESYQKAIDLNPAHVSTYYNLGITLNEMEKYEEAVESYQKAIDLNPTHVSTYYNLGIILDKMEKYEEAIEVFQKAVELNPENDSAYNNLGNVLDRQGKYEEAVEAYEKAISLKPDNALYYSNLGNTLARQKNNKEAIRIYQMAIDLSPGNASVYNNLGNALDSQKRYEEAVQAYQKAIDIKPNNALYYSNLGNTLSRQGKYEQALKMYHKVLKLEPDNTYVHYNLGNVLYKEGKYEEAVQTYQKAIELNPTYVSSYNNLGLALYKQEKYEEAVQAYQKAIELNPTHVSSYNNLGLALYKQEKYEEAIEYYKEAIKLDPKNIKYNNNLASALKMTKDYSGALTDLLQKIGIEQVSYDTMINILENDKEDTLEYEDIINSMTNYNNKFLQNLIEEINDTMSDTKSIFKAIIKIIININYFKSSLLLKEDVILYQYTSINTLSSLLKIEEDTKDTNVNIRLYNTEYMNDPEEGKFLSNLLRIQLDKKNKDGEETITKLIHNICDVRNDVSHAFISSLTENEDDIPMWKMYGDDNKGISLGFKQLPISEDESLYNQEENENVKEGESFDDKKYQFIETSPLTYRIKYFEKDNDLDIEENPQIKELINTIFSVINEIHNDESISSTFNTFLSIELDKIKFLVKNKKYEYEKEYRLLQMTKDFACAKHDPNNPKLFLEVNTISLEKVIFGVNFENYYNWIPFILKKASTLDFSDVKKSDIPLR